MGRRKQKKGPGLKISRNFLFIVCLLISFASGITIGQAAGPIQSHTAGELLDSPEPLTIGNIELTGTGANPWTSIGWNSVLKIPNIRAVQWEKNLAGKSFGIGQSNGGLAIIRANCDGNIGCTQENHPFAIRDTGEIVFDGPVGIKMEPSGSNLLDVNGPIHTTSSLKIDGTSALLGTVTVSSVANFLNDLTIENGKWIRGLGRLHVKSEENIYLISTGTTVIGGSVSGGSGNLQVDQDLQVNRNLRVEGDIYRSNGGESVVRRRGSEECGRTAFLCLRSGEQAYADPSFGNGFWRETKNGGTCHYVLCTQ